MRYNPGLEHSLSSEDIEQIKKSDEYTEYTNYINDLTQRIANLNEADDASTLKTDGEAAYRLRSDLFRKRLQERQQAQKLDYETKPPYDEKDWHQGHFDRVKHMLPEARLRLSHSMMLSGPPRSKHWKYAIEDLIYLRNMDCSVAWQKCMQPKGKACPVENCCVQVAR